MDRTSLDNLTVECDAAAWSVVLNKPDSAPPKTARLLTKPDALCPNLRIRRAFWAPESGLGELALISGEVTSLPSITPASAKARETWGKTQAPRGGPARR